MSAISSHELDTIDGYLDGNKSLVGLPPEWQPSSRPPDMEARWFIEEESGYERSHLRFRIGFVNSPSISLIFRGNPIWRVDFAPESVCKRNPHDGSRYGLDPIVCGNHEHSWLDNREFVRSNGLGVLPYRRALPSQIRRLPQAYVDFAGRLNLTVTPDQRGFDVPPQGNLLPEGV